MVRSSMANIFLVSPMKVLGCWKQVGFLRMAIFGDISQVDRRDQELMSWLGPQLGAMAPEWRVERSLRKAYHRLPGLEISEWAWIDLLWCFMKN